MADKTVTVKASGGTYASLQAAFDGERTANPDLTATGMNGILTIECYAMADTNATTVAGGPVPVVPPAGGGVFGRYEPPRPWSQAGWIEVRGVEARGQIGRVRVRTDEAARVEARGVEAWAEVGDARPEAGARIPITGITSRAQAGQADARAGGAAGLRGVASAGHGGSLEGIAAGRVRLNGLSAAPAVGYLRVQTADPVKRLQRVLAQEREDEEALQALEVFEP